MVGLNTRSTALGT